MDIRQQARASFLLLRDLGSSLPVLLCGPAGAGKSALAAHAPTGSAASMLLQPILATLWQPLCLPAASARQLLPPRMSASPQALFERGRDEMQAGQLRAARDSFAALLELEPDNTVAQFLAISQHSTPYWLD